MINNNNLFKHLIKINYKINKDKNNNNILYIIYDNNEIKCYYILLFIRDNNNNILWSDMNPYIDQYTNNIVKLIRNNININDIKINDKKLYNILTKIKNIKYNKIKEFNNITCEWILSNNYNNYIEYYMITNIIYY
jgi:hypothetical protein